MKRGHINLEVVQGNREKSGNEVALVRAVEGGCYRRKVLRERSRESEKRCLQATQINFEENEKWFKEMLRKSYNGI